MKRIALLAMAAALLAPPAAAQETGTWITVYNQDLALVRQARAIPIQRGVFSYMFEDVSARIDPTSVSLETLSGPPLSILEQNYAYDLVSDQKVLEKSIGLPVTFFERVGEMEKTYRGTLLSAGNRPVLQMENGIYIGYPSRFLLEKLPEGLITKPSLQWLLDGQRSGDQNVALSYLTGGLSWNANYVLLLSPDEKEVGFTGWVTLNNTCGIPFENARLKLMAGDVHRVSPASAIGRMRDEKKLYAAAKEEQFEEKSFFEYHLYTLQRPVTILNNQTKQIELASSPRVPVDKVYVYDGAKLYGYGGWYYGSRESRDLGVPSNTKVDVNLEFDNKKVSGMGIPLPKGIVRVTKKDSDGTAQFVGEDAIDHTPKDERVRIKMGEAFDIVGERKRTDFKVVVSNHVVDESFEITLRNHKEEAVTVKVVETLYRWSEWEMRRKSRDFEKIDSQTVVFPVTVPADGEAKVTYTVRYTW